jgi:hypothetical protein
MDEAFACPECGSAVEVEGLAPGRQVRCGFCLRLLEVPYMPRVAEPAWKRRRFGKPWWVPWAWTALGVAATAIVLCAAIRVIQSRERDALARSIDRLSASAEQHEGNGDLDKALLDLDTAINLCSSNASECSEHLERLRAKRQDVARRGAQSALDALKQREPGSFGLGEWLNLRARAGADGDLAPLQAQVEASFQDRLRQRIEYDLATARASFEAGKPAQALERCESMQPFWGHLSQSEFPHLFQQADQIVVQIVDRCGIVIEPLRGHFLVGTAARYNSTMVPEMVKRVKAKGFVPPSSDSRWRERWSLAPYHLSLELKEQHVDSYMSSENRLTRIDADLRLLHHSRGFWQTTPTVRTTVPLPKLPAYLSTRLALGHDRIDEFERMLYDDARTQIDGRIALSLDHMPDWTQAPH